MSSVSDEDLAEFLEPETHSEEIDTESLTPGDHIDPELVAPHMLLGEPWHDDDGMQIGVIETDDGYLLKAHRPGEGFGYDPDAEPNGEWIVDRCGDFSTIL